jgi:iron(III) transport system substrate-binding protein
MCTSRRTRSVALLVTLAGLLAACGGGGGAAKTGVTLTLYNAQSEAFTEPVLKAFTKDTGIKVDVRAGKDFELANQIAQEGKGSPADVLITENSPAMKVVQDGGLFTKVDPATLAQVPAELSPRSGDWVGVAARSTVLIYNPKLLPAGDLPASIMDLADPRWKGKVAVAPAGADFQAIASAVVQLEGRDRTAAWLKGLKDNGRIYQNNIAIMRAVNAGEIAAGITYHYYWYQDRAESGKNSKNAELHYFGGGDPGAFLSVSGLGVLASTDHPAEAQRLVAFFTGPKGQKALADSTALEYPIGSGVTNPKLKPLSDLHPPTIDPSTLNGAEVLDLLRGASLL